MSAIADRVRALAERIDAETDGVVILMVGDVDIVRGITATGNEGFDVQRLMTALEQAIEERGHG